MTKHLIIICALLLSVGGLGATAAATDAEGRPLAPASERSGPHPRTIVEVTGDKRNGFGIFRYDGSAEFPPTDSEARAECSEYDVRRERVRCRTEVEVWYHALRELKRSIRHAQAGAGAAHG